MRLRRLVRSELLSTFFPTWIWQGREWAKGKVPKYDPYYWINAHAHPVLSSYYPFSAIVSALLGLLSSSLDVSFRVLTSLLMVHVFWASIGWFQLISTWGSSTVATFGAITFTLAGYNWKQQPCSQYTFAWFPWLLYGIATQNQWLAGISLGMVILAGYYPIGIQVALVAGLATIYWKCPPLWVPIGILIGFPQIVPFMRYLPKTIRANKHDDIGRVPWWQFASLIFPKAFRHSINGVGYWEMSYYVGIIPLLTVWYTTSNAWVLLVLASTLMLGLFSSYLPRIPARWSYTFQFALIWCAVDGLNNLHLSPVVISILCLLQLFDLLLNNSSLLVNHPYAELYQKPSWAFNTKLTRYLKEHIRHGERVSGMPYPGFTGHIPGIPTLGYSGGMQLRLMSKWRSDSNPNGSGGHDYFVDNNDGEALDRYRVRFAYTSKKLDWKPTGIRHLWENPRLSA